MVGWLEKIVGNGSVPMLSFAGEWLVYKSTKKVEKIAVKFFKY